MSLEIPLACDLSVFTPEERAYHGRLYEQINAARQSVRELEDGYALQLPGAAYTTAAEFMRLEHVCCPFFRLILEVEPGQGSIWLHVRGSDPIKAFVEQEFALA